MTKKYQTHATATKFCRLWIAAIFTIILAADYASAKGVRSLDIASFGVQAGQKTDATPAVRAALEQCRKEKVPRLIFSPGRYDFWPDQAFEKYLFVSNNDEGIKRIAFPLVGFDGIEVDGRGATFVLHGFLMPFLVEHSRNVRLKNLTIDYARTFHSEGKVLAVSKTGVDLEISDDYPYEIRNGVIVFTDGKKDDDPKTSVRSKEVVYPYGMLLAFDPKRRETAYMAQDRFGLESGVAAQAIGPRKVHLSIEQVSATVDDILVFGPSHRDIPGFVISESAKVTLSSVTLYHAGGMGVIAQRSRDIELENVRVTPQPGGKRIVSATADATHFVNCTGKIQMCDCLFENQKDDATNIHGLYARITGKPAPDKITVQLMHPQQAGIDFILPGMRLEIVDGPSLTQRGEATVRAVQRINKEYMLVTVTAPLPLQVQTGDCVADADANTADVVIRNCTIRNNRARGILLGSRGKIVVEGNTFHSPGTAILFEGDGRFWFEQAGVRDVTIRGNTFDNCNFGVWGNACIGVGSGISPECRKTSRYNRNILIENNFFRVFGPQTVLGIYSVDGLTFRNNRIEKTNAYPPRPGQAPTPFDIVDSDNVHIDPADQLLISQLPK